MDPGDVRRRQHLYFQLQQDESRTVGLVAFDNQVNSSALMHGTVYVYPSLLGVHMKPVLCSYLVPPSTQITSLPYWSTRSNFHDSSVSMFKGKYMFNIHTCVPVLMVYSPINILIISLCFSNQLLYELLCFI